MLFRDYIIRSILINVAEGCAWRFLWDTENRYNGQLCGQSQDDIDGLFSIDI